MATKIRKERVLGNFRPDRRQREAGKRQRLTAKVRDREGNSDAHLAALRRLPCIVCLRNRTVRIAGEAHHLKSGKAARERGTGQRASDRWAIPLCRDHHEDVTRNGNGPEAEDRWFNKHAIDQELLARRLWDASPDHDALSRVVFGHAGVTLRAE